LGDLVGEDPGNKQLEPAHRITDPTGKPQAQVVWVREEPAWLARRCNRFAGHFEGAPVVLSAAARQCLSERLSPQMSVERTVFTVEP
jgi:hypothetical protein